MIPCETQSLSPLWSSFIQAPLLRSTTCFYWLWINNAVGSYNIDRDKLSTDCWDNKAILGLLCGLESCLWSLCYAWGGEGLSGFPSVNYTRPPLDWARVATVHKSSCHAASCSHISQSSSVESAAQPDSLWDSNMKRNHTSAHSSSVWLMLGRI